MRDEIIALKGVIKKLIFWKVNKDRLNEKWDGTDDSMEIEAIKKELEYKQTDTRKAVVDLSFREISVVDCIRVIGKEGISEKNEIYGLIEERLKELSTLNRGLIVRSVMNDRKLEEHLIAGMDILNIEI